MKKVLLLLILFLSIICCGCKKDVSTNSTDITLYSWKLKSVTIDEEKLNIPNKDYHGDNVSNDRAYELVFENDTMLSFNLGINNGEGKYKIQSSGVIDIEYYGVTKICCNSDFDKAMIKAIGLITSYQVLDEVLILNGYNCEMELMKE